MKIRWATPHPEEGLLGRKIELYPDNKEEESWLSALLEMFNQTQYSLDRYEAIARRAGWSEEMNCTPWDFLDSQIEDKSRWIRLKRTSNSGKTMWVCSICGRNSVTPDKTCKTFEDPDESWECSKYAK